MVSSSSDLKNLVTELQTISKKYGTESEFFKDIEVCYHLGDIYDKLFAGREGRQENIASYKKSLDVLKGFLPESKRKIKWPIEYMVMGPAYYLGNRLVPRESRDVYVLQSQVDDDLLVVTTGTLSDGVSYVKGAGPYSKLNNVSKSVIEERLIEKMNRDFEGADPHYRRQMTEEQEEGGALLAAAFIASVIDLAFKETDWSMRDF